MHISCDTQLIAFVAVSVCVANCRHRCQLDLVSIGLNVDSYVSPGRAYRTCHASPSFDNRNTISCISLMTLARLSIDDCRYSGNA